MEAAGRLGIPSLVMGDVIRREAVKQGLEPSPKNTGRLMLEYRERYGMDIFARLIAEEVEGVEGDTVLIDGVRNPEELEYFRGKGWDVIVVAVMASPKTRYERLRARGRIDDVRSYEEFLARDEREMGVGMDRVILYADYYLVNDRKDRSEAVEEAVKILEMVLEERRG